MCLDRVLMRTAMSCACGIAGAALLLSGAAAAQPAGVSNASGPGQPPELASTSTQGLGLRLGYGTDYDKATLVYETPKLWGYRFQNGWGRVDLDIELGLSYWKARRGRPDSMGQISAIPMLRWWPNDSFYLEAGSGPTVLSRSQFADYDLSTRFQFGSHLGLGFLAGKAHRIGLRYSHYSNADIKKPNPGLDLFELAYTYQF